MAINRKQQLDVLLEKLKAQDGEGNSDIDLVLMYIEDYLANPQISRASKKIMEFEVLVDPATMSRTYKIHWRSLEIENVKL